MVGFARQDKRIVLAAANGNVELAVSNYFDNPEAAVAVAEEEPPPRRQQVRMGLASVCAEPAVFVR